MRKNWNPDLHFLHPKESRGGRLVKRSYGNWLASLKSTSTECAGAVHQHWTNAQAELAGELARAMYAKERKTPMSKIGYIFAKSVNGDTLTTRIFIDDKGKLSLTFRRVTDGFEFPLREVKDINKIMRYAERLGRIHNSTSTECLRGIMPS